MLLGMAQKPNESVSEDVKSVFEKNTAYKLMYKIYILK